MDLAVPRRQAAEADAAGAVALGEAVDDDADLVASREREDARGALAVVDELAVHLVGHQEEAVLAAEAGHRLELVPPIDGAGRVAGVAQQHQPRAGRERPRPLLDLWQVEAVLAAGPQRDELDPGHRREGHVVRVERLDHEGLVALARARQEREQQRLAAPGRDHQLVGRERDADAAVVLAQSGHALRGAGRGGVGEDLGRERELGAHRGRGLEVGLADVQVKHLHPAALRRVGERHQLADRGRGHPPAAFGDHEGHRPTPFSSP